MGPFIIRTKNSSDWEYGKGYSYPHKQSDGHHHPNCDDHHLVQPDSCCGKPVHNDCKKDCLCRFLHDLICEMVTITTKTGAIITGQLKRIDGCCIKIITPGSISPFMPKTVTIIRCEDIESVSFEV